MGVGCTVGAGDAGRGFGVWGYEADGGVGGAAAAFVVGAAEVGGAGVEEAVEDVVAAGEEDECNAAHLGNEVLVCFGLGRVPFVRLG